jgi:hypothetical protein
MKVSWGHPKRRKMLFIKILDVAGFKFEPRCQIENDIVSSLLVVGQLYIWLGRKIEAT